MQVYSYLVLKNDRFTKTGSLQTLGMLRKERPHQGGSTTTSLWVVVTPAVAGEMTTLHFAIKGLTKTACDLVTGAKNASSEPRLHKNAIVF